ncbi:hypothetical protein EXIGLDRAFT_779775 [Exidia glandulosa HHB12029]|uniref:Uncharacterized protein n=1 Tax=Exidia glandulosa HHB12029 TaxID=1314781 RepID=A0A165BWK2_EXIGL|nr:hypothetical protein EXIGLDRAFT_779775 [Exidia glandulosa HHB12029]
MSVNNELRGVPAKHLYFMRVRFSSIWLLGALGCRTQVDSARKALLQCKCPWRNLEWVNALIKRRSKLGKVLECRTKRTPAAPLRIAGVDTTASGNIVVYAADGLTSEDLLPRADKVLVNGVPTHVHGIDGLPSDKELLDEIVNYNSHEYEWACMPRWLGRPADVQMRPRGSVILAFLSAADAAHAIQHSVSVFGNFCSARRFEDVPRVRTCDNCCGIDHTGRICEREMRCGVCCSNQHTTASHKCEDISCDFYSQVHAPGAHCEHTELKCPHCNGAHVVRDAQCKVWQSRRNALRKPQHIAAKTGGRVRRTQSRAALGTKDGRPVSGANALELGKANDAARKAAATSNRSTPPAEPAQVDSA